MSEKLEAYNDVYNVAREYGSKIKLLLDEKESQVVRDDYGTIISREIKPKYVWCFDIEMNPSTKKLQMVGIQENCNILVYISMKDIVRQGLWGNGENLDMLRGNFEWLGESYKITDKKPYSQFNGIFLYFVIGGLKN